MFRRFQLSLATKILFAMLAGSIVGLLIGPAAKDIKFIGEIWLNVLKLAMVPIVFFAVVNAISSMETPRALGRLVAKVMTFYISTVMLAALIGLVVALVLQPGVGFIFARSATEIHAPKVGGFEDFVTSLFSSNLTVSFFKGDIMQVLVVAIIIGISVMKLDSQFRQPVSAWFSGMSELTMSFVNVVMKFSPIGVFCIMAAAMGESGLATIVSVSKLIGAFYLACAIQMFFVYFSLLWILAGVNPIEFTRKGMKVFLTAISTCSSAAVIPVNLQTCDEDFNVSKAISRFSIPCGVQFNQDGGAILCAVVVLFSAQAVGTDFSLLDLGRIVLICTIASAGGGAIPGGGIVRLMVTSAAVGLPLEIVAVITGFYRLLDMGTTSMCCVGDLAITVIIDRLEKRRLTDQIETGSARIEVQQSS